MKQTSDDLQRNKISPEFEVRLALLRPQQKVRAIVMLRIEGSGRTPGRRQLSVERQEAIEAMRKSAKAAMIEIDGILERYDGQRLGPTAK